MNENIYDYIDNQKRIIEDFEKKEINNLIEQAVLKLNLKRNMIELFLKFYNCNSVNDYNKAIHEIINGKKDNEIVFRIDSIRELHYSLTNKTITIEWDGSQISCYHVEQNMIHYNHIKGLKIKSCVVKYDVTDDEEQEKAHEYIDIDEKQEESKNTEPTTKQTTINDYLYDAKEDMVVNDTVKGETGLFNNLLNKNK